jgi:predicted nucleic-acid-binding protein
MKDPVCFVDTNVFVRYLTGDDEKKAAAFESLLVQASSGKIRLVTSEIVIAELVWVLESFYKLKPSVIAELIRAILNTEGLRIKGSDLIEKALDIYESQNIDFIDAHIIVYMQSNHIETLYSFDKRHLSKVGGIRRIEP